MLFETLSRKFNFRQNRTRITGNLANAYVCICKHIPQFFLEQEIFRTKFVEKVETHILCSETFFPKIRAVYEVMWKNMVGPDRPQMAI
jgi:hypothetical protein